MSGLLSDSPSTPPDPGGFLPAVHGSGGLLAPRSDAEPISHCIRCGKPTPAGVSLCDIDNPGGIKAPSSTQVHGTMLLGVAVGIVGFLLLARMSVGHFGPFPAQVTGASVAADASVQAVVRVANQGGQAANSTCRVTRDGSPRSDDLVFRTTRIPAGGSVDVPVALPAPEDPTVPPYTVGAMTVSCT
jgi:hypothetical protein